MFQNFVCYGSNKTIKCDSNQNLSIISANYGRTNSLICIGGQYCTINSTFSNIKCLLDKTSYFQSLCNDKNSCQVTTLGFVDPCVGTFKYLDIIYQCDKTSINFIMIIFFFSFSFIL